MFNKKESQKLKSAFEKYSQSLWDVVPPAEPVETSKDFDRKMDRLLRRPKKICYSFTNTWLKRAACIAMAVVTVGSVAALSVRGSWDALENFAMQIFKIGTDITIQNENVHPVEEFVPIKLKYIPEGFRLETENSDSTVYEAYYWRPDERFIDYTQKHNDGGVKFTVNTEGAQYGKILLAGKVEAFVNETKGHTFILWSDELSVYSITSDLERDEVIKIAESILK